MEEKCIWCKQKPRMLSVCGSWCVRDGRVNQSIRPTPKCYETELAAFKSLVREMALAIDSIKSFELCTCPSESNECSIKMAAKILSRPEVRGIMISPQPSDPNTCCGEGFILSGDRTHWTCDKCGREYPMLTTKVRGAKKQTP